MNLKRLATSPYPYILLLTYFGVWLVWDILKVPFSNPQGIISYLPSIGYNPTGNLLRFGAAVFAPPLACLAYWWISTGTPVRAAAKYRRAPLIWKTVLVVIPLFFALSMAIVQGSTSKSTNAINGSYGGPYEHTLIDTFHEGETLGMATSYQDPSKKPYRDFVFVHGVFQDPLRSVLAFNIFHESIGAARTLNVLLLIVTFVLYYVLLLVIFRRDLLKAAFGMLALALLLAPPLTLPIIGPYMVGIQLPVRDIATILFLISAIIGLRAALGAQYRRLSIASFCIGFIAVVGFANSIDRALYVTVLSILWMGMIAVGMKNHGQFWKRSFVWSAAGGLIGLPLLGIALKWAFADFVAFFASISGYKEFLDGMVFEQPDVLISGVLIALSAAITICGALFMRELQGIQKKRDKGQALLRAAQRFVGKYYLFILLLATALIFMRSAIGRAGVDHLYYSITWLYLLITIGLTGVLFRAKLPRYLLEFVVVGLLCFTSLYFVLQLKRTDIRKDTFPLGVSDQQLVRTDHWETAQFLKNNLHGDESFVTLTSEASWYYLVGKPSPVKYPIIWFAFMPDERKELAQSIDNNSNIKYILTNNNWTSNIDYVSNQQRFPEVYDVLHKKYEPRAGFGQQTVWERKP